MPENGLLFPAFNDRSSDIHGLLYYAKNPENLNPQFVDKIMGGVNFRYPQEIKKKFFRHL